MACLSNKTIVLVFVVAVFAGQGIGQTADRELLVQFTEEVLVGSGGAYPGVLIGDATLDSVLSCWEVEYMDRMFTDSPQYAQVRGEWVKLPDFTYYYLVRVSWAGTLPGLIQGLKDLPIVRVVDKNTLFGNNYVGTCAAPGDPAMLTEQWYYSSNGPDSGHVNIAPAWELVCDLGPPPGLGPKVGLIDSGAYQLDVQSEPELRVDSINPPTTVHGTLVLSTIGAVANNAVGIAGIGRYLQNSVSYTVYLNGTGANYQAGISAVLDVGATVLSSSVGFSEGTDPIATTNITILRAVQQAFLRGIPFVTAAGQEACTIGYEPLIADNVVYPGKFGMEVITVGATDRSGNAVDWGYMGSEIDMSAPGEEVAVLVPTTIDPGGSNEAVVDVACGTSYAQPFVAGAITLMQVVRPDLIAEDYQGVLESTCVDIGTPGKDIQSGWGRVDIGRAVCNLTGSYELVHASSYGGVTVSVDTIRNVKFYDFGEPSVQEGRFYDTVRHRIQMTVVWPVGYIDSAYSWGMHIGTNGLRDLQTYSTTDGAEVWLTNVNMSYPDPNTLRALDEGIFYTYAYEVLDEQGAVVVDLGPIDPDTCRVYCGAIGKARSAVEIRPVISERATYVVPRGSGGTAAAVLGVMGVAADGDTLAEVRANVSELGDPRGWIVLERADAALWTGQLDVAPDVVGEYTLPIFASDADGNACGAVVILEVADVVGQFVDKSTTTGDLTTMIGDPTAAVAIDYDTDGVQDILIGFSTSLGRLLRGSWQVSGAPDCADQTALAFPFETVPPGALGLVSADIDNDGDEDLFVCHAATPKFFRCERDSSQFQYVDATATTFEANINWDAKPDRVYAAAWTDYNRDGWIDLAVIGAIEGAAPDGYPGGTANLILYRNAGGKLMFSVAVAIEVGDQGFVPGETPVFLTWMDVDQNGRADLLVSDAKAGSLGVLLFKNEGYSSTTGDCSFVDRTQDWFGSDRGPDSVVAARVFDYDNDGRPDLVLARSGTPDNLLIYRNMGTHFEEANKANWSAGNFKEDLNDIVVWDFDHNGAEDLVIIPAAAGAKPRLLLNGLTNAGSFGEVVQPGFVAGNYRRGVAAEWRGDRPAIFFAKSETNPSLAGFFYTFEDSLSPNDNAYTRLQIGNSGTINGSGIGTQVLATFTLPGESTPTHVYRTVDGGSGNGGQQARTLDIGLGGYSGHQVPIVITWPDGTQQSMAPPVTSGFSPEMVVTINKTTAPLELLPHTIRRVSVNASATFNLGLEDDNWWVFQWDMNHQAHGRVRFESTDTPAGCSCMLPGATSIDLRVGDQNVDYDVLQIGDNLFRHRLTWRGRCCYQNCDFDFAAFGAFGSPEIGSGTYSAQTGAICTSGY